ncbi:LOW QUALITY PROTEIN: protein BREAST CANCER SUSCEPTIBILITY 1 homolog [Durio zibethinus]|uniref:LOW QUALITY PROTEIN: protein BREAST CANCER SUSCEPTIBILITY 1 homolog n=1 Tax=Durio zibethinus TaxID=66656 RepID=A0A6P6ABD0_DURZI|nr:LOW QUALITY PROTEIN: protein BREAST CANCER SUSCEPTIBILITY 1 homolog [Durio zibethinus]
MGDPSYLEKMGRELKCPICLSLLNSAVSLTCNHVFCNACIMKSMKSGSNCPVCKVPYRRREVRPAPHMDNLVSIYKSMEIASGFNIFVTQNPPLDKSTDDEKRVENDLNCSERVDNQGATKRKGSRVAKSTENSGPIPVKPSFLTNKRVQVPQYPLSETPMMSAKLGSGLVERTEDESKRTSDIPKENYSPREKGEPIFTPFFWLREEDAEKPSQLTDGDQFVYITPPEVPSFSDMKDSDDEGFSKEEVHGNTDNVNLFDSEMFEWTQRACSPELLSSPVKMQLEDTDEPALQGSNTVKPCINNGICMTTRLNTSEEILPNVTSFRTKAANNKTRTHKSREMGRKYRNTAQKKIADRTRSHVSRGHADPEKGSESFNQNQAADHSSSSSYLAKARKNSKVAVLDHHEAEPIVTYVSDASENAETSNQADTNKVNKLPARVSKENSGDEYENLSKGKSCRWIIAQCQKKSCSKSKKQKLSMAMVDIPEEISTAHNQTNEKMILRSPRFIPVPYDKGAKQFNKVSIKRAREVKSALSLKSEKNLSGKKKMKVSFSGDTKTWLAEEPQQGNSNFSPQRLSEKVQGSPTVGISDGSTVNKLRLANEVALRKFQTVTNKIQCAFCLSTEDSEASGEMFHYYDGRSVPLDHNGGFKVIHSHKNCAEWAPNVYFENDKAINLEAELCRSRKIKCSCCGLKGAALGCYEKSCRKSFHVPCAKLVSQCRWDTENFVMLCPLHASSKLPNENPESQESRKRCVLRGSIHHNEVPINNGISVQKKWNPCGSHKKLVLCCSALSVGEREIISEFEKLSGVTVLKRWDSSVTHIIASIDENGACKRTLKILMGILEGKWMLNVNWVKDCIKAMKPVDELRYEITIDVHGIRDGPRHGRLRLQNKQPKLFDGSKFYMMGDFEPSYRGYLQDLVITAGGAILHRKPISGDQGAPFSTYPVSSTFIIYSVELPDKCDPTKKHMIISRRQFDAEALASSTGSKAVSNSWVLNSISACKLQSLGE